MMESKTKVRIIEDDQKYYDYKKGEEGYIDGYVRGGDNTPYACVVIGNRIKLVNIYRFEVIN